MNAYDIIFKKRNGGELSREEIEFFVKGVTAGDLPPEQAAAWLMAAFLKGLTKKEMVSLTTAMTHSGEILDLASVPGDKVDKHSTGGVGDGTSLVLAPLLSASGVVVPMMSGRALGHTGGTLDKLEAIPGFRVDLTADEFRRQLSSVGCAMIGQTAQVAPADKKLYALRDVTATVDSVTLIAASIMSKKLAEGTNALVLDVKTGSGAFMQKMKDARALAAAMTAIGNGAGVKTVALITNMDQPLGGVAGNALEIRQAVEVLKGGGPADFCELILTLGAWMLVLVKKARQPGEARKSLEPLLRDGRALEKFRDMVRAQGGDPAVADKPEALLPRARFQGAVPARRAGYVVKMDTRAIGMLVSGLG
ncbi:MAG TPA: thymidine phosphorylase, partial [Elusimicrobiota bacterium]|nr:thymidine phosphorylase [Elusimicrobiota bacterium]